MTIRRRSPRRSSRSVARRPALALLVLIMATHSAPATPIPTLRAVEQGSLAMSPNGQLEERLTLNRDLPSALLAVALEGSVRLEDWPVSPGVRETVTLVRHDVYAPGARVVKIAPEGEVEVPHSRLVFFWGSDAEGTARVVISIDPGERSLRGTAITEAGTHELAPAGAASSRAYRLAVPDAVDAAGDSRAWTCGEETLPPLPPPGARTTLEHTEALAASFTKSAVIAVDTDN